MEYLTFSSLKGRLSCPITIKFEEIRTPLSVQYFKNGVEKKEIWPFLS